MYESSEQSGGPKLQFMLINPDGSPEQETDPQTFERRDAIRMLNPDEVRKMKGMGFTLKQVEPKPDTTRINLSQTAHDKEE
jgi:hypothetical protein